MGRRITFALDDKMYSRIEASRKESGIEFMSEFMRGLVSVVFSGKFSSIEVTDAKWIKYLYILHSSARKMVDVFTKTNPENTQVISYLNVMITGITNLVDSVYLAEEFLITPEQEALYIDAINIFLMWLDRNELTEYNIKKFAERMKQTIKDR